MTASPALLAQIAALQLQLDQLTAAMFAQAAPTVVAPVAAPLWPQYVQTKNGVTLQVYAPLNPVYVTGMMTWILAHAPGTHAFDPSNGGALSQPLRSPNGFPLVYPSDGKVATGPGVVAYGDQTFKDETALVAYLSAVDARDAQEALAETWQAEYAARARPTAVAAAAVPPPVVPTVPVVTGS